MKGRKCCRKSRQLKKNQKRNSISEQRTMNNEQSNKQKVVLIVAFRDFRDEECFIPKQILENAGIKISIASNQLGTAIGSSGGELNVDIALQSLTVDIFDAIVFIGGQGALSSLDNETSYNIARETVGKNKILGAICISPLILAKAGVLKGKMAAIWTSNLDKSAAKALETNGAVFKHKDVIIDGKIITANGPKAAQEFGQKLIELLNK